MKELLSGLMALIGAMLLSVVIFPLGILYSLGYSIWLSLTLKKWTAFFIFWWRLIDGYCAAVGHLLLRVAYTLDIGWNVTGEIIEDIVTTDENTYFTTKDITVSASIGNEEVKNKLTPWGKRISKVLNIAFNQKCHAKASYLYLHERQKIEKELFTPLK